MQATMENNAPIRLLIADDHAVVREGLAAILTPRCGIEVIAQASNGQEAIALFQEHQPDVTLMDLRMPELDGLAATRMILAEKPDAQIIILTTFGGDEENCLRAGAKAVVLKDAPFQDLLAAIRREYDAPALPLEIVQSYLKRAS